MKLLLDEQLPIKLASYFPGSVEVFTVRQLGWDGVSNGKLLARAAEAGMDALITADKNLEYQQNPENIPLPVLVLLSLSTKLEVLAPFIPSVLELLGEEPAPGIHRVEPI